MITLKSHYQPSVNKRLLNGGQYKDDQKKETPKKDHITTQIRLVSGLRFEYVFHETDALGRCCKQQGIL